MEAHREGSADDEPCTKLDIHDAESQCLQRKDVGSGPLQSEAGGGCCSWLWDSMQRCKTTAHRQWARKRGKFKPTPKYIFLYGVLPLGLVLYMFIQLSDIFIDFTYYSDVHVPCGNLTKPYHRVQALLDSWEDRRDAPQWQAVVYNETYVLSAYLDKRVGLGNRLQVRVLGLSDTYKESYPDTDYCQLWYGDSVIMESVRARRYVIQEHHGLR